MLVEQYRDLNKERSTDKIDKYFDTKTLKRLQGKGLFCGMDFVGIDSLRPIEYYSRFEHSRNVAYTAWKLSEDLSTTLAGAFHDVGSLSFAHVNSFKKKEGLTQEHDELSIKSVLKEDEELLAMLDEDGIRLEDVIDPKKYPLIDKSIPALCLDRLDGILATCLFFAKTHSFDQIRDLYYMVCYFENLNGMCIDILNDRFRDFNGEIVLSEFGNVYYEDFFKAINAYSSILLTKEDRFMMEILGLTLKYYEDIRVISERDLFYLGEQEIIDIILSSRYSSVLEDVLAIEKIRYAAPSDDGIVVVSKPKIRQANPLCMGQMHVCEIDGISGNFFRELVDLGKAIELTDKPITADLSKSTVQTLKKYLKS